jgi:hypothetical protein
MKLFLFIIAVAVIWWWVKGRKPSQPTSAVPRPAAAPVPAPKITVTLSAGPAASDSGDYDELNRQRRDQGALTSAGATSWVLNPKSPLPLTLLNADEAVARQVKDILDDPQYWSRNVPLLSLLIAQHNLRFKEVDEWIRGLKPRLEADLASRIQGSREWAGASEKDRSDIRSECQQEAIGALGVSAGNADLATLLLKEPQDCTRDDELMKRFNGDAELYSFYLGQLGRANPVVTSKAEDWGRKSWERLAETGLALRGKDIPLQLLLEGQRLKDLNEILAGSIEKPIGRKAKALETVLTLPDLQERLSQRVSFRELFMAVPPADIEVGELSAAFNYASQVATVVCQTYDTAGKSLDWQHRQKETPQFYRGWEITHWSPVPACAQTQCRKYSVKDCKFPPYHIGCTCEMRGIFA